MTRRVDDALRLVQLAGKKDRRIGQLSGGERQRVALARALMTRPAVLLLDEPLARSTSESFRLEMQLELVDIQRSLGVTFVYITHSQEEALTMSDRVILMRAGRIEQNGTPIELFDRPVSRFAAEFMGFENLFPCIVRSNGRRPDRGVDRAKSRFAKSARERRRSPKAAGADRRSAPSDSADGAAGDGDENIIACKPANQMYRGKYIDQIAETPIGEVQAPELGSFRLRRLRRRRLAGRGLRGAATLGNTNHTNGGVS